MLAASVEKGHGLIPALEKVPELLPPQVLAMLKVGATLGDFRRVLPACRHLLHDGTSQTRALINYQIAFGLVLNPMMLYLLPVIFTKILPLANIIAHGLAIAPGSLNARLPALYPLLLLAQMALLLDDTGEFRWRLINGAHGARGFFSALEGWQAALDAKAFQLEQAAAQALSTSLVLINAVTVTLIATGVFQIISQLSNAPFRYK